MPMRSDGINIIFVMSFIASRALLLLLFGSIFFYWSVFMIKCFCFGDWLTYSVCFCIFFYYIIMFLLSGIINFCFICFVILIVFSKTICLLLPWRWYFLSVWECLLTVWCLLLFMNSCLEIRNIFINCWCFWISSDKPFCKLFISFFVWFK